jgi:hypothetical protein
MSGGRALILPQRAVMAGLTGGANWSAMRPQASFARVRKSRGPGAPERLAVPPAAGAWENAMGLFRI